MVGRWPYQTASEDADQGLDAQLAELITSSRDWLSVRGFMTLDGPLAGGGNDGDRNGAIGWNIAVVSRTHAAMCAAAVLRPGWGSGHWIMGGAEQVFLTREGD